MKRDRSRVFIGAVVGTIVMAILDYLTGKITSSIYAIPVSVFLGAIAAGNIAKVRAWMPGVAVGLVSSGLGIGIAYYFYPQMNADQINSVMIAQLKIIPLNIICGVVGGNIGGYLARYINTGNANASP